MFQSCHQRRGCSYLEVQVAMILLSIGMAGLYSISVVHTKQTRQLTEVMPPTDTPALNRVNNPWAQKLGVYASVSDATLPPDPVLPYAYFEQTIDNHYGSPSVVTHKDDDDTYGWVSWGYSGAYNGNLHYHRSYANAGSYMEYTFSGLADGEYEVLTTWPVFSSLGDAIPHQIYDGNALRSTVRVNQKVAPGDVSYDGRQWDRLAVVEVTSGTLRVRLVDGPGCPSYIIGDGFLVRSARSFDLLSVTDTPAGGATAILEAP